VWKKTAHVHPATCNLAHWLIRLGSPTVYRCFALPQLLYRRRHQHQLFWIPPRISGSICPCLHRPPLSLSQGCSLLNRKCEVTGLLPCVRACVRATQSVIAWNWPKAVSKYMNTVSITFLFQRRLWHYKVSSFLSFHAYKTPIVHTMVSINSWSDNKWSSTRLKGWQVNGVTPWLQYCLWPQDCVCSSFNSWQKNLLWNLLVLFNP
jgi:hypothetical protein